MNDNVSLDEKLKYINLVEFKDLLPPSAINEIYNTYMKKDIVLSLLNKILTQLGGKQIKNISDFKISSPDLIKINGGDFIDENIESLDKIIDDPLNYFEYKQKDIKKRYIVFVVNKLVNILDYELKSYISSKKNDTKDTRKNVTKYKLIKN